MLIHISFRFSVGAYRWNQVHQTTGVQTKLATRLLPILLDSGFMVHRKAACYIVILMSLSLGPFYIMFLSRTWQLLCWSVMQALGCSVACVQNSKQASRYSVAAQLHTGSMTYV